MTLVHHRAESGEEPEYWYWEDYRFNQSQRFATEEDARRAKRRGLLKWDND